MYSVTFAMTVIVGIALMNLFLGFAAALLVGRGPKRWSDLEEVFEFRYFSPRQCMTRRRPDRQPSVAPVRETAAEVLQAPGESPVAASSLSAAVPVVEKKVPHAPPASSVRVTGSSQKLVLMPKVEPQDEQDESPERLLGNQIDAWRVGVDQEETPSVSGICITLADDSIDQQTRSSLMNAIQSKIARQLRRDRRVLRFPENVFAWFSSDMPPDDALMPLDRIRQMIEKTRFLCRGTAVGMTVRTAVISAGTDDSAEKTLARLRTTLKYASEKGEGPICLDTGDGPSFVEPTKLDIEESEYELVAQ